MPNNNLPSPHPKYGNFYIEEAFRHAAYTGDINTMDNIMSAYSNLDVNAADEYGQTALYLAAKRNEDSALDKLIEHPEVDINRPTILGNTALLISAWNDNTQQAKKLIEHGADLHAKTNQDRAYHGGVNALDIARERGNASLVALLEHSLGNQAAKMPFLKQYNASAKIENEEETLGAKQNKRPKP